MLKKIILSPWTAVLTLAIVLSIRIADPAFIESVRLRYFDTLITNKPAVENNIYTVNIDEYALDEHGQWPFPRDIYADIIEDIYKRNAGLVVWNVMMPERDRQGGDDRLSKTLEDNPTVLTNLPAGIQKNEPRNPGAAVINSQFLHMLRNYPGIIANIPTLESKALGVGTIHTDPEIDGVNRRMPLIIASHNKLYPSLAMEVLRVAAGDTTIQVKMAPNGVEKVRIPKYGPITTDNFGRVWIDWSQQAKSISVTRLPDDFKESIVIVGVTAAGINNPVPTAMGAKFPHEVQAAVVGTLLNGVNIERPDYADGAEIIAMLIMGLILIVFSIWRAK